MENAILQAFADYRLSIIKALHGSVNVAGEVKQDAQIAVAAAMLVLAEQFGRPPKGMGGK
jgi:hypothetical protein